MGIAGRTVAGVALGVSAVAGSVAAIVASQRQRGEDEHEHEATKWRTVSILKPVSEVMAGGIAPAALARLGENVEVRAIDAPGGRGTELSARYHPAPPSFGSLPGRLSGRDPVQRLREALREAKQLLEAGETPTVDPQPHGVRKPTPFGALTDFVASRSSGEGIS